MSEQLKKDKKLFIETQLNEAYSKQLEKLDNEIKYLENKISIDKFALQDYIESNNSNSSDFLRNLVDCIVDNRVRLVNKIEERKRIEDKVRPFISTFLAN